MPVIQVIINDSTNKTIAGTYYFDRDNGGTFIGGAGTSFPGSPVAGEWFWRTDEDKLYRRNNGNDAWDTVVAGVGAHASTHENSGGDEVSVAGLSGELADDQPPKAHLLGSSTHTQDTLANLNAKVSDATLIDTTDSRLSDDRDPTSHASSHESGGGDAIKLDDLAATEDNTDLDSSTSKHGLLPKLGGGTTNYLRADGTWVAPPGGTDPDAIHDNVTGEINAIDSKESPVGADVLIIEDSAASFAKKKVSITNLPGGADPDAIHDNVGSEISAISEKTLAALADMLLIEDSADSNAKKSLLVRSLPGALVHVTDWYSLSPFSTTSTSPQEVFSTGTLTGLVDGTYLVVWNVRCWNGDAREEVTAFFCKGAQIVQDSVYYQAVVAQVWHVCCVDISTLTSSNSLSVMLSTSNGGEAFANFGSISVFKVT